MPRASFGILCCTVATVLSQQWSDEEVLASLKPVVMKWRNHINTGESLQVAETFTQDAVMSVSIGPQAETLNKVLKLENPAILRDRQSISRFWYDILKRAGLQNFRAYEDEGPFSSAAFIVNKSQVIISGTFGFKAVKGKILSETWVRMFEDFNTNAWQRKSAMYTIDEVTEDALSEKHRAPEIPEDAPPSLKMEEPAPAQGSSHQMLWLVVLCMITLLACFFLRRQRKVNNSGWSNISGYDNALG
mmetsp:Transcript_157057/g.277317  ORF Transcript_157057/g.277317 Transcript_157057/m.277317 type:complete len:246 (-) Transcript_157057:91-828(-)